VLQAKRSISKEPLALLESVIPVKRIRGLEGANDDETASWIAQRIMDVEKNVKLMPTVAVLVNSEDEVKPMAERLTRHLEEISLKAVACEGGRMLGEETDIRVFDIQHIKGLEFEAVFFAGIDQLAEKKTETVWSLFVCWHYPRSNLSWHYLLSALASKNATISG